MTDRLSAPVRPPLAARTWRTGASPWPVAAVCAVFVAAQLALTVRGSGLGWDETVYTSQVSGHVPAAFFSAPRARGVSFAAAPVAWLTGSTTALRLWMGALSGAGLFAAVWPWRPLLPPRLLALAAALLASLWISLFYGPQVMPNLGSAYGALAATGCLVRAARAPAAGEGERARWGVLAGLAAGLAVTGLMRPPDALWLAAALGCAALVVARGRRGVVLAALGAGLVLGCGEWVIEAYVRYGGLAARLNQASVIQGGLGWHVAFADQLRSLDGRTLCRPCDGPWRHKAASAWWLLLPFAAAGGVAAAPRARRTAVAVAAVAGVFLAAPYLLTIGYAAPRFLLPAYALLAIPVAECARRLAMGRSGRWRPVPTALVAVALCAHLGVQLAVLHGVTRNNRLLSREYAAVAARLHAHGVRPPCVLSGDNAVPVAYYTGCASRQMAGPDRSIAAGELSALSRREPVALLIPEGQAAPGFAVGWTCVALPLSPEPAGERACMPVTGGRR
ncbi:MAG: hypothetical protein FWE75_19915 [Actinomycetia bacterium]|nr:hypothetical protein [Actinomycetes bacterium]